MALNENLQSPAMVKEPSCVAEVQMVSLNVLCDKHCKLPAWLQH